MRRELERTPAAGLLRRAPALLRPGKALRARLTLNVGRALDAPAAQLERAAAAVELVHTASLLHDDVIDGGRLRRGAPTFWVAHGVQGAILLGDLMLCRAMALARSTGDPALAEELIERAGDVCRAEVEQELRLRGVRPDWKTSVRLAREKTGALFAFAAVAASGPNSPPRLRAALREAGFLAGTAYQLSDDILDTRAGAATDKTLGQDAARKKVTAHTARRGDTAAIRRAMRRLTRRSAALLSPWPTAARAWRAWLADILEPALRHNAGADGDAS